MAKATFVPLPETGVDLTEAPINVLHVDDETDCLKTSKQILETQGSFKVETATSVEEAQEKMRKKEFDAIISEYIMSGKDGLEFLKELRNSGNKIPFIIFTGKGREIVAIKALNLGADQYINKIGKPEAVYSELTHAIREVVKINQAEKALQKSEENYRRLFENAPAVILTLDLKGNVTSINKVAEEYGFKKDEVIGKNMRKFILKRYWPKLLKDLVQLSRGKTVKRKIEIDTPKGKKTVAYKSNPIIIDNKVVGIQSILTDITEQKNTEEALRKSEKSWSDSFNSLEDIMIIIGKNFTIKKMNDSGLKLLGKTNEEVVGKKCYQTIHGMDAPGEFCPLKRALKTGKAESVDRYEELFDKYFSIKSSPIFNERGEIVSFVDLMRDITERKKAEKALRQERKTLETVTQNIGAGLTIISKDYHVLWANKFLRERAGAEEGKSCYKTCYKRTSICPGCGVKQIFETGKDHVVHEQLLKGPEGQPIWLQITSTPIRDANENITAALELSLDITERKRAEEQLKKSEEKYRRQFEEAMDGIVLADVETGIIVEINRALTELVGRTKSELVGEHQRILHLSSEINGEFSTTFTQHLKEKEGQVLETQVITKTGEIRDVEIKANIIFETRGRRLIQGIFRDITERKRVEEALRESEEKYRELLNGMNDTAWVINLDGNIIDVNDAAVEALGYSKEELLSIGLTGIDSNLNPEQIKALVKEMPADEVQVFETVHTTKDGKEIPVEISSSLVTYKGKQAILSIARDITERKKVREELRQSEERYRTVFENTGTAMCILEEDKTISMINRQFEELSGYSRKEVEGKKWTEFVTKDSLERMQRYHEAKRKRGRETPTHYPFNFINKKGQIRNALLTINLIPGTKKSVASILDITASKKTEKALREAEKKYRKTILKANVGIISYDAEGKVKVFNPKMWQITGFKRSEIPTLQDWFEKLYPNKQERRKIRDKWFKKMMEEGEVKKGHAIITTKDGKRRDLLFNGVRLESGDSIAFAEDITERKKAEEKLNRMMNELVTINEKLGVVGRLTRHDARNKLSIIANNIYLAKQKLPANNKSLGCLSDIESAIDQMEKIFDFARNYEMLGVEELTYMDVRKSVDEAAILLSGMNGIKLVNECQGLTVMADSLLRQLFYNLIDDTLKHGEKVRQIRVHYEEGKDQLNLLYEDDGVGIPENEKELIFKEGYGKGTGYGLYLIKKICEAYGWTIRETGKQGKGAQFTMTIPKTTKNGKVSYCFDR
jgi:PAS domain S-box-containing protein